MKSTVCILAVAAACAATWNCPSDSGKVPDICPPDICPFDDPKLVYDPNDPYPFCQLEDVHHRTHEYCPQYEQGWGNFTWVADGANSSYCDDGKECTGCLCFRPCGEPAHCPAPSSGTAMPDCLLNRHAQPIDGACFLRCDNGETCPNGMGCHYFPEDFAWVCVWVTSGARCSVRTWNE